jgi:hypothetical protein
MGQGETGYQQWTEEDLVRETVSNFESLEGVDSVQWASQGLGATFSDLIRVNLLDGTVIRLSIAFCTDEEEEEAFDGAFSPR